MAVVGPGMSLMYTFEAVGAVLEDPSGIVIEDDVHPSPLLALLPFAVRTAISTLVVPVPVEGAVQSNDQERYELVVWVADWPELSTLTDMIPVPGVESVPLSTTTLNPPLLPETPPEAEIWILYVCPAV